MSTSCHLQHSSIVAPERVQGSKVFPSGSCCSPLHTHPAACQAAKGCLCHQQHPKGNTVMREQNQSLQAEYKKLQSRTVSPSAPLPLNPTAASILSSTCQSPMQHHTPNTTAETKSTSRKKELHAQLMSLAPPNLSLKPFRGSVTPQAPQAHVSQHG